MFHTFIRYSARPPANAPLLPPPEIRSAFIYTFTKYSGFDPEISSNGNSGTSAGVDRNSAPLARTVSLGLNLSL